MIAGPDAGIPAILLGIVVLVVGVAGVHGLIGPRYGGLGYAGFVATQLAFVAIFLPLAGLGFLLLIPAGTLLAYALLKMRPPLVASAVAIASVWPLSLALEALTGLTFAEAIALLFALPYAVLALEARRLPAQELAG